VLSNWHIAEPEAADFVVTSHVGYRGDAAWPESGFLTSALFALFETISSHATELDRPDRMCHRSRSFTRRAS
jgi:hypothetical protein